MSVDPPTAVV
jgi:hypothetical protein